MDLTDARALLDRAKRHYAEFGHLSDGQRLWHVNEQQDAKTGDWAYGLAIQRRRLVAAGPVIADCANNVSSALDHIAAAIAKARGHPRLDRFYFPWGLKDDQFKARLEGSQKILGAAMTAALADARAKHWHEVAHVHAAKQISREGKHWELKAASGSAHGVGLVLPNFGQQLFQVPATAFQGADFYEFHRGPEQLDTSKGWTILVGIRVDGLGEGLVNSPDSIFPCAFRYVQGTIDAVEQAAA